MFKGRIASAPADIDDVTDPGNQCSASNMESEAVRNKMTPEKQNAKKREGEGNLQGMFLSGMRQLGNLSFWRSQKQIPDPTLNRAPSHDMSMAMIAKLKIKAGQARQQADFKQRSRYILEPDGHVRITTDFISVCLLTYTIFEIPYTLIFLDDTCGWDVRIVLNLLADIFFMVEIVLNLNTAYFQEETMSLIVDRNLIVFHYIKGWFPIDVLSSVPIDRLVCAAGQDSGGGFVRTVKVHSPACTLPPPRPLTPPRSPSLPPSIPPPSDRAGTAAAEALPHRQVPSPPP